MKCSGKIPKSGKSARYVRARQAADDWCGDRQDPGLNPRAVPDFPDALVALKFLAGAPTDQTRDMRAATIIVRFVP